MITEEKLVNCAGPLRSLAISSKRNFAFREDKYYFFQPATNIITRLSVPNSCRTGMTFTELIYLQRVLRF